MSQYSRTSAIIAVVLFLESCAFYLVFKIVSVGLDQDAAALPFWLVLLTVVNGVAWTYFPITLSIPFQLPGIKPREIATAIGFLETAVWAGALIGPLLTGVLEDYALEPRLALVVASAMPVSLSICAMLLPRKWDELTV